MTIVEEQDLTRSVAESASISKATSSVESGSKEEDKSDDNDSEQESSSDLSDESSESEEEEIRDSVTSSLESSKVQGASATITSDSNIFKNRSMLSQRPQLNVLKVPTGSASADSSGSRESIEKPKDSGRRESIRRASFLSQSQTLILVRDQEQ